MGRGNSSGNQGAKIMTHLLSLLSILQKAIPEQTRFLMQGSRYMKGGEQICNWFLDVEADKLYKLTIEETTIEEALAIRRDKKERDNEQF